MAAKQPTLSDVLEAVHSVDAKISKLDKRVAHLERDMKRVLHCVSAENAEEFPPVKNNSNHTKIPFAAKS